MNQRRALLVSALLLLGAVVVGALMAAAPTRAAVQVVDDAALRWAESVRTPPATVVAELLSLLC